MNRIVWERLARYLRTGDLMALGILAGRAVRVVQLDHVMILGRALGAADPVLDKLRSRRRDLRTRFALPADLRLLQAAFPHHAGEYGERLRRGDQCLLVESEAGPQAFTWLKLQGDVVILELGCRVALPPRGVWGYDTFVVPQARLGGAFLVLMVELLAELRRRQSSSVFGTITHTNRESLAAHQRAGYRLALTLTRVQLPGLSLCRILLPGGRPRHAAFGRRAPEVAIEAPAASARRER